MQAKLLLVCLLFGVALSSFFKFVTLFKEFIKARCSSKLLYKYDSTNTHTEILSKVWSSPSPIKSQVSSKMYRKMSSLHSKQTTKKQVNSSAKFSTATFPA